MMRWQGTVRRPLFPDWLYDLGHYAYAVLIEVLAVLGIAIFVALLVGVATLALMGVGINWAALD